MSTKTHDKIITLAGAALEYVNSLENDNEERINNCKEAVLKQAEDLVKNADESCLVVDVFTLRTLAREMYIDAYNQGLTVGSDRASKDWWYKPAIEGDDYKEEVPPTTDWAVKKLLAKVEISAKGGS